MWSIHRQKMIVAAADAHVFGKLNQAPTTISTHAPFFPVCIEVFHPEIISVDGFQQHEPISPNAKFPVAKESDLFLSQGAINTIPVIEDNKIIPRPLVLVKIYFHF
jgi:hypothetical protein